MSFFIVGIIWLNHHATLQLLATADHGTQVLNLSLLLPVSVLPWPTAVLAEYARADSVGDHRVAVLLYGGTSTCMALTFNLLWRRILRHPELHRPGLDPAILQVRNCRYNLGLCAYPIATAIGLLLGLALLYLLPTPRVSAPQVA